MRHRRYGFTLVELLVVIGIIAVLVAVLLPALAAARRQAAAVKCATQLREIGNAFQMYALEYKGYYPPSQLQTAAAAFKYNVDGVDYPLPGSTLGAYWFTFLAKYVTKSKMGYAAQSVTDGQTALKTVFWGCPNWDAFRSTTSVALPAGGVNLVQIGYGMTYWPDATPTNPADASSGYPAAQRSSFIQNWRPVLPPNYAHRWWRQTTYGINGSNRALVADSRFWSLTSQAAPTDGVLPPQPYIQNTFDFSSSSAMQTYADLYRHGKYPPVISGQRFSNRGGKIAYNILYADGHVSTVTDWREAYKAVRMKFPG